ncbi:MAG: outer membrane beta-barrel protein [Acidobacteria bacterium]|nr:outer membrane beta-barrel protein [Acidobacteriota bacterium]
MRKPSLRTPFGAPGRLRTPPLLGILLLALSTGTAGAQDRRKTWEVSLFSGLNQYGVDGVEKDGDFAALKADTDFLAGLRVGYNLSSHWQLEAVWDFAAATVEEPYADVSIDFSTAQLNGIYNFRGTLAAGVDPYLIAGIGTNQIEIEGRQHNPQRVAGTPPVLFLPFVNTPGTVWTGESMIQFGLGMRVFGTEQFGFRFELKQKRYDVFSSEATDDEFTFGVMWSLGRPEAVEEEEEEIPLGTE